MMLGSRGGADNARLTVSINVESWDDGQSICGGINLRH